MMKKSILLPKFIRKYLMLRLNICLIAVAFALLLTVGLIIHMNSLTVESFMVEVPERQPSSNRPGHFSFNPNCPIREAERRNNSAPQRYQTHIEFLTILAFITGTITAVFAVITAIIYSNIKCLPFTSTYYALSRFGKPNDILTDLNDDSFVLTNKQVYYNERFLIIPKLASVSVYPTNKLTWGYVVYRVHSNRYSAWGRYYLSLHIGNGLVEEKKIKSFIVEESKQVAIDILNSLKKINPSMAVGYNRKTADSQKDDLGWLSN